MATVSTPVRQPFGILNDSKIRNLQSIKNRQNAITPSSAPSLKRRAPSPELSDSENIDPAQFDAAIKRKRASFDDDVSLAKQPRLLTTKIVPSTTNIYTPVTSVASSCTPLTKAIAAPISAPAAAGRSPTRPHAQAISRLSKTQPRRRFAPPSLSSVSPSISIASALRGTLAHKKTSSRSSKRSSSALLEDSKPKSWFFDIYEESEETQDYKMCEWTMTQSSAALDISDDESKTKPFDKLNTNKAEDRGKENVDPNEMFVQTPPITRAAAARAEAEAIQDNMDAEEPRTPLGDLNASKFYGEGLDATSVVLVHDGAPVELEQEQEHAAPESAEVGDTAQASAPTVRNFAFETHHDEASSISEVDIAPIEIPEWMQGTLLSSSIHAEPQAEDLDTSTPTGIADIEIWESESAKDENEQQQDDEPFGSNLVVVGEGQTISLSGRCLSER